MLVVPTCNQPAPTWKKSVKLTSILLCRSYLPLYSASKSGHVSSRCLRVLLLRDLRS